MPDQVVVDDLEYLHEAFAFACVVFCCGDC